MKKSKLSEQLRSMKIFNTHGVMSVFGGLGDVAISYHATDPGRGGRYAHVSVWSVHFKTDPDGHWQDRGNKWFGGKRDKSIPAAMAWAKERYGITEWAPCPMMTGAYVPKHVLIAAKKAVEK